MNHIIVWCFTYLHFLCHGKSQWTNIWFEDGTFRNSTDKWSKSDTAEYDYRDNEGLCLSGNCAFTMSNNNDWIKRQTNIAQYSQLRVKYHLGASSFTMPTITSSSCRAYYAYDSENAKTMIMDIEAPNGNSHYNQSITLEAPVGVSILWLWFQAEPTGDMPTACYWDNIHLEGIIGDQATTSPTLSPNENFTIHTEWREIWFEDGTFTEDPGEWTMSEYPYADPGYEGSGCFTGKCVVLSSIGTMMRSTDVTLYKEVRLQYDLSTMFALYYGYEQGACRVYCSYDSSDESAKQLITNVDHLTGQTEARYDDQYTLFPSAIGKNTIYIWFSAYGTAGSLIQCFWDNIYLQGLLEDGIAEPTVAPTRAPTPSPTRIPTKSPIPAPSKAPTAATSIPSPAPTKHPSSAPSKAPTAATSIPSPAPTKHPSSAPVKQPTVSSLDNPTKSPVIGSHPTPSPSYVDTIGETIIDQTSDLKGSKVVTSEESNNFGLITLLIGIALVLMIFVALLDGKKLRPNDYFSVGSLLEALMQMLDTVSDVLFAVRITKHSKYEAGSPLVILFVLSIVFIFIPVIVSVVQLYLIIMNHWNKNDRMRAWLRDGIYQLLMLSVVCGSSFSAIQICSSNAFDLTLFSIPLSNIEKCNFKTRRIYSMVLLENVPQLIIAICFTVMVGFGDANNGIVYVSMIFSAMSIFMMFMSSQTTKELLATQQHSAISLNVTGTMFGDKIKRCRKQTNKIKRNMSILLGVDEALIEVPKPQQIHNGFRLEFILFINHSTATELDIKNKVFDPDSIHVIAEFVGKCWELGTLPTVEVMKFKQSESEQQEAVTMGRKSSDEKAHLSTSEIKRPVAVAVKKEEDGDGDA